MAKKHLTPLGKLLAILIGVAVLGVAGWQVMKRTDNGSGPKGIAIGSPKYDAAVIVDTYTGWAPIVWGNGGMDGSDDSYFYKKFGVKLKIVNMDDFNACRSTLKNGITDIKGLSDKNAVMAFCTLDSYPTETASSGDMTDMTYFMIHNFSNGADAIVVRSNINTVEDLRGKKIAYSECSAGHSLLLNTLETSGIKGDEVTQVVTGYGNEVAQAFNANQVDAAVVFTPDDEICLREVKGSKVLLSTKQINTLVTDGFIAKKEWVKSNPERVKNIIQAMLWANSEITNNPSAYEDACRSFSDNFGVPIEDVMSTGKKINFATLEDNVNWFGLNSTYTGMTGSSLYTKMSTMYAALGLTKAPLSWNKVSFSDYVDELSVSNNIGNEQMANATKVKQFTAPEKKLETAVSISDKQVNIEFPTNGYTLSPDAQSIIDMEFAPIVKSFNGIRIRVEGNTDNTGNTAYNIELSKKRAQAVVNYLVTNYSLDPNQFIIVGNGPKHAVEDGVSGANAKYRITSLQLVQE